MDFDIYEFQNALNASEVAEGVMTFEVAPDSPTPERIVITQEKVKEMNQTFPQPKPSSYQQCTDGSKKRRIDFDFGWMFSNGNPFQIPSDEEIYNQAERFMPAKTVDDLPGQKKFRFQPPAKGQAIEVLPAASCDVLRPFTQPSPINSQKRTIKKLQKIESWEELRDTISDNDRGWVQGMNSRDGLWVFGHQFKGGEEADENIVGEATWDGQDIVYKFAKFPNWRVWWEKAISEKLQLLSNLKHFVQVLFLAQLPLKCNAQGHASPVWVNIQKKEKWAMTDVLAYKKINGITFETAIRDNPSKKRLMSGLYQLLSVFHVAQTVMDFTHYDAHAGNVIVKKEKYSEPLVYLYDFDTPLAVPVVGGYRMVVTDLEFSYVDGLDGKRMDSRFDLLCRSVDPTHPDKGYDSMRLLVNTLKYYGDTHGDCDSLAVATELREMINSSQEGKFYKRGFFKRGSDSIFDFFALHQTVTNLPKDDLEFVSRKFYHILNLLTHNIRLPLRAVKDQANVEYLVRVFTTLLELRCDVPEHRIHILYDVIADKDVIEIINNMQRWGVKVEDPHGWHARMSQCVTDCIPHLETALFLAKMKNRVVRSKQREADFTPIKMFEFISKRMPLRIPLTPDTIVIHMTRDGKRTNISMSSLDPKTIDELNKIPNMLDFSKRLQKAIGSQ